MWHVWGERRGEEHTGFWWGDLRERDHLDDISMDGIMILKWFFRKWGRGLDSIHLAQDMDSRELL
jgi:hypothetical protein